VYSNTLIAALLSQHGDIFTAEISHASLLDISAGNCQRALVDETGMIINQMGMYNRVKQSRCKGRLGRQPHKDKDKDIYNLCRYSVYN
jgi:hypothetical protein